MTFAIYIRVSEVGGREGDSFASPELQEAAARRWAEAAGIDVFFDEAECIDLDVSGAAGAEDRRLGRLIDRCEAGEFGGIIVQYEDRFARDVIEGARALARIHACGARLIATQTGFDSQHLNAQSRLVFNFMMSVGQAQRERNLEARMRAKERAVSRGVYCAPEPFGYDKDDDGRLVANGDAEAVRLIFRRRAEGIGFSALAREVGGVTRGGVRRIVMNRAYVGEQRIPDPNRRGEPKVIADSHPPLVTEAEWQAANAVRGRAPIHNGAAAATQLKGVVRCGVCSRIMHVSRYGKARDRLTYSCTGGCGGTSMALTKIEPAVLHLVDLAIAERAPHVKAVIEGDRRYDAALLEVTEAQATLAEYRDSVEIQRELGVAAFAEGLHVRREAVETAQRALREVPRPDAPTDTRPMTIEEYDLAERRRFYARVIDEVRVFPRSAEHRLTLRWRGSDEQIPVQPWTGPADPGLVPPIAVAVA